MQVSIRTAVLIGVAMVSVLVAGSTAAFGGGDDATRPVGPPVEIGSGEPLQNQPLSPREELTAQAAWIAMNSEPYARAITSGRENPPQYLGHENVEGALVLHYFTGPDQAFSITLIDDGQSANVVSVEGVLPYPEMADLAGTTLTLPQRVDAAFLFSQPRALTTDDGTPAVEFTAYWPGPQADAEANVDCSLIVRGSGDETSRHLTLPAPTTDGNRGFAVLSEVPSMKYSPDTIEISC
ncbi:MAG: hypothetical protein QOE83_939 [Actinomycetota bacterium]|nr:hypothetical protein [Actinomycetota bacterium]